MSSVELDYRLQPMRLVDLPTVLANERRSYTHPWSEGIFRDCLKSGNDCVVFQYRDKVVGHGIMSIGAGESHLLNVCIIPDYQGCGYGRVLVEFMVDSARKQGAEVMFLEVRPSNDVAVKLYQALGFNEVGRRPGYYPAVSGREDAIVLARELSID